MRNRGMIIRSLAIHLLLFFSCASVSAQEAQTSSAWATDVGSRYWVQPDIVYQGANNQSLKLDVWYQHDVKTPSPTLVYIHGGGWIFGTKEGSVLQFLPFLEKGWTVVNIEYRMASSSLAVGTSTPEGFVGGQGTITITVTVENGGSTRRTKDFTYAPSGSDFQWKQFTLSFDTSGWIESAAGVSATITIHAEAVEDQGRSLNRGRSFIGIDNASLFHMLPIFRIR